MKDWKQELTAMLEGWDDYKDTDNFMYQLVNSLKGTTVTNALSEQETAIVNLYRYGEKKDSVKLFEKAYADLLG
mgnify:CR=1 FL=1